MTPEEFILKLEQVKADILLFDTPLRIAAYSSLAAVSKRIFTDGKNAEGGSIGSYNSKDPIYLNPKKAFGGSKLGAPRNEDGETKFKNGNNRATVYLKSYKDYKSILGKPASGAFVNLELSGDMKSDFESGKAPREVSVHEYVLGFSRTENVLKKKKFEEADKYGKIFALTPKEVEEFIKDVTFEFKKILSL
jgi:hypothetical protein